MQIIQCLVWLFGFLLAVAIVDVRLNLPSTKYTALIDLVMVLVILIYALGLRIYFST